MSIGKSSVQKSPNRAVILTALGVEYEAVRLHLSDLREETHPRGTVYECGRFDAYGRSWDIAVVEVGPGNEAAAQEAERAINFFDPSVTLFVGVAGGVKDVSLGDVVAATKVYGYESGKAADAFEPRPNLGESTYGLEQRARAEKKKRNWLSRVGVAVSDPPPRVFVEPIAAGSKVITSTRTQLYKFLRKNYGDAVAVEMEGRGFLKATRANRQVEALVVRGISDLLMGKSEADASGSQEVAARHAAAFAFEVLAKYNPQDTPRDPRPGDRVVKADASAVRRSATEAREALDPILLPRISRPIVRTKYLPSIRAGLKDGRPRVVTIVGPAGYGKSTALGDIYDELIQDDSAFGWVALARCNDLGPIEQPVDLEKLARAFGVIVGGEGRQLSELAASLTQAHGAGVVLIDTLDLILDDGLVPALRGLLRQLVDLGVTAVITCRDYEYGTLLEPSREKLSGLAHNIFRYEVPEFSLEEVRAAAIGYFRSGGVGFPTEDGVTFTEAILNLSADNRSLRQIVEKPLLLAMLCDLFGREKYVPADLTVSKLYNHYWEEKIAKARRSGRASSVAAGKRSLCLNMARQLLDVSKERGRLIVSLDEYDLLLAQEGETSESYGELLSDGVLRVLRTGHVNFFHQTFLEYVMARWLATVSGGRARNELLTDLRDDAESHSKLFWYPVVRQLLTVAEPEEFLSMINALDLSSLEAFRAIAYAAASRSEPTALENLLPTALENGSEFQNTLRDAAETAPNSFSDSIWNIVLTLLRRGGWNAAVKTAQAAGSLVIRRHESFGDRFSDVFEAIDARIPSKESDDKLNLMGWFLNAIGETGGQRPRLLFHAARGWYSVLGPSHRSAIVRLHLDPSVTMEVKRCLLEEALKYPATGKLKDDLTTLVESLLPSLVGPGKLWETWMEALYAESAEGWDTVQARAAGRCAAKEGFLRDILMDLFEGAHEHMKRNLTALNEALRGKNPESVSNAFLSIPQDIVPVKCAKPASGLVTLLSAKLNADQKRALASWVEPLLRKYPYEFIPAFAALADGSIASYEPLVTMIDDVPAEKRARCVRSILRHAPSEVSAALSEQIESKLEKHSTERHAVVALLEIYGVQAQAGSEGCLQKLVDVALSEQEHRASAAARTLVSITGSVTFLRPSVLLPLSRSKFTSVRLHWVEALAKLAKTGFKTTEQEFALICKALENEKQDAVWRMFCDFVLQHTRSHPVPDEVVDFLCQRTITWCRKGSPEAGLTRALIVTFHMVVQNSGPTMSSIIATAVKALIETADLQRIRDGESEATNLLGALSRSVPTFLSEMAEYSPRVPPRNSRAIAYAIKRVDGAGSPLLDRMLSIATSQEVRSAILKLREA